MEEKFIYIAAHANDKRLSHFDLPEYIPDMVLIGVYDDEDKARVACTTERHFYIKMKLNYTLIDEPEDGDSTTCVPLLEPGKRLSLLDWKRSQPKSGVEGTHQA